MFGNVSIMRVQNTHFTTVTMLTTARALPQYNRRSNFLDRLAMDPADHAIVRMAPDFFEDAGDRTIEQLNLLTRIFGGLRHTH